MKPLYVIDGELFIDTPSGNPHNLNSGTRVYMHHDASITVAGSSVQMALDKSE
ncbi:MAG: hypothetical protein R2758_08985 [Bacteroidales bacterium]